MTFEEELSDAIRNSSGSGYGKASGWVEENVLPLVMPVIDRWTFRKPTFEDGEPVQFGDTVKFEDRVFDVDEVRYGVDNTVLMQNWEDEEGGIWRFNDWEHVEHPKPVLAADGLPLEVGQTVYTKDGIAIEIVSVTADFIEYVIGEAGGHIYSCDFNTLTHAKPVFDADGVVIHEGDELWPIDDSECAMCGRDTSKPIRYVGKSCIDNGIFSYTDKNGDEVTGYTDFANVTHDRPDSLERIREDANKTIYSYWGCGKAEYYDCDPNCEHSGHCTQDVKLDLIDRTVKVMERGK